MQSLNINNRREFPRETKKEKAERIARGILTIAGQLLIYVGYILIPVCICYCLYLNFFWFVSNIIQIIDSCKSTPIESELLAWGIVKFLGRWIILVATVLISLLPGILVKSFGKFMRDKF